MPPRLAAGLSGAVVVTTQRRHVLSRSSRCGWLAGTWGGSTSRTCTCATGTASRADRARGARSPAGSRRLARAADGDDHRGLTPLVHASPTVFRSLLAEVVPGRWSG